MGRNSMFVVAALLGSFAGQQRAAANDTAVVPIHPEVPWVLASAKADPAAGGESSTWRWRGDMLVPDQPGTPALNYEHAPGILYLSFEGVTLTPSCPGPHSAHSALNCSPLIDDTYAFPAWGSAQDRAAVAQELANFFSDYNLVLTVDRPPDWVPYTLAVVGGSASAVGHSGACGVANVQCDGLKRNHVSLTFPQSCSSSTIADTIAQETAHNWGLEHTDDPSDLLYPVANGGFKTFVDECMDIVFSEDDEDPEPTCGYVHEVYCPAAEGAQQNTHAELLGVFGPRQVDDTPPVIVSIEPADGSMFTTEDTFSVTAKVEEDSPFLAVKWTWLEGLPSEIESYTACTNGVCDEDYNVAPGRDPGELSWDFTNLVRPPAGRYSFKFEAMDVYFHYVTQTITIEVVESSESTTGGEGPVGDGSGSADGGTTSTTTAMGETMEPEPSDTDEDDDDDDGGNLDEGSGGCSCRAAGRPHAVGLWLLLLFGARSRQTIGRKT